WAENMCRTIRQSRRRSDPPPAALGTPALQSALQVVTTFRTVVTAHFAQRTQPRTTLITASEKEDRTERQQTECKHISHESTRRDQRHHAEAEDDWRRGRGHERLIPPP